MKKITRIMLLVLGLLNGASSFSKDVSTGKNTSVVPSSVAHKADASKSGKPEQEAQSSLFLIDRIEAVIYGLEGTDIVTKADIERPYFVDGKPRKKDEVILERLIFQDALKHRIPIGEEMVDSYLEKMRKSAGVTTQEIEMMFEQAGYTKEEGRRQLAIMYGARQMEEYKVTSRLVVPEAEVHKYYEANPLIKPASYVLERAFVAATPAKKEEVRTKIDTYLKTGKGLMVGWRQLPEIEESDLAESKQFITKLAIGEVSKPQEIEGGFELFKLKAKKEERLVPLEERYREIVETLRRPKVDQLLEEYKKSLLDSASILYF